MNERIRTLERRVTRLTVAVGVLGVAVLGAGIALLVTSGNGPGSELAVERLDIVEPDGQLALALSNSQRVPVATMDGHVLLADQDEERNTPAIIFFDGRGDEVGGLMFGVEQTDDGFSAVRHFSLDGYNQDQTVVLFHYQDPEGAGSGLRISDRPEGLSVLDAFAALGLEPGVTRAELDSAIDALPEENREERLRELFGVSRISLASDRENTARLQIRDGSGRPRIRIEVPEEGDPSIAILDEAGEVVSALP